MGIPEREEKEKGIESIFKAQLACEKSAQHH